MPRHRRIDIPGAIHHVITRGIERCVIFKDDADRKEFIERFAKALKETNASCYGWALMPNHFHLLIRTGDRSLSDLMRKVLSGYAVYFNARHKRRGYLYQNRYKSILCQEESYLLELVRYIHLNPLRAKIVENVVQLNKYLWCGHSVIMGNAEAPWQNVSEILSRFSGTLNGARHKYCEFIEDGVVFGHRDDLTGGGLRRSAGGWEGVLELKRNKEMWRGDERILGDGDFVNAVIEASEESLIKKEKMKQAGWNIDQLIEYVSKLLNTPKDKLCRRSKGAIATHGRSLVMFWAYSELGISGVEIARYFGITRPSVSVSIEKGRRYAEAEKHKLTI